MPPTRARSRPLSPDQHSAFRYDSPRPSASSAVNPAVQPVPTIAPLSPLALSVSDAASALGIGRSTVDEIINAQLSRSAQGNPPPPEDRFPVLFVGNRRLVSVDGLRDWIRRRIETGSRDVGP
jgi:hypothetical protein